MWGCDQGSLQHGEVSPPAADLQDLAEVDQEDMKEVPGGGDHWLLQHTSAGGQERARECWAVCHVEEEWGEEVVTRVDQVATWQQVDQQQWGEQTAEQSWSQPGT